MQPATYDFDVITDAPAPRRRPPEPAEQAPHADAEEERRRASLPQQDGREKIRAAE